MYLTKCLLSRVSNHFNLILFSLNLKFSTAYLSSNFLLETLFDQFSLFKIFTLCGFLREALTLCPKPFPLIMGWKKFWRSISNLWKKFSRDILLLLRADWVVFPLSCRGSRECCPSWSSSFWCMQSSSFVHPRDQQPSSLLPTLPSLFLRVCRL